MKTAILLMAGLASSAALANPPAKSPSCAAKLNLRHPEGSGGVFFDTECTMAYVLPPSASDVKVSQLAGTEHIGLCEVINSSIKIQQANAKALEKLMNVEEDPVAGTTLDQMLAPKKQAPEVTEEEQEKREKLMTRYMALNVKFMEMMNLYSDYPAASAIIQFRIPWDKLVENYQAANSNLNIRFQRMPLTNAYLTFNRKISKAGSASSVIDYDIPGIAASNGGTNDAVAASSDHVSLLGGDSFSGQVVMSLAGACPFYDKITKKIVTTSSSSQMTAHLNAMLNYSYDLSVYRHYIVSYDLSMLAKKIKTRSTSGGFFSSSTSVSEVNSMENSDWFKLDNKSNDSRYSYDLLVPELKADLMNRVIRDITMMSGFNPEDAPQVQARTKNGAQASAEALQKCPNVYCQVGAMALTVLDSIFGSSSAVSTYIDQKHSVAGDEVIENKMLRFYGTSSFEAATRKW